MKDEMEIEEKQELPAILTAKDRGDEEGILSEPIEEATIELKVSKIPSKLVFHLPDMLTFGFGLFSLWIIYLIATTGFGLFEEMKPEPSPPVANSSLKQRSVPTDDLLHHVSSETVKENARRTAGGFLSGVAGLRESLQNSASDFHHNKLSRKREAVRKRLLRAEGEEEPQAADGLEKF